MVMYLQQYNFLVLSLLFLLPGAVIVLLRSDLRAMMFRISIFSIPFAATEFLFYPDYWEPEFLCSLIDILGFGVEDLLFVIGLSWLTSAIYPVVFSKRLSNAACRFPVWKRLAELSIPVGIVTIVCVLLTVRIIYTASIVMMFTGFYILIKRRDLLFPAVAGAFLCTVVYSLLCFLYMLLLPDVFHIVWHTEQFSGVFILGIPFEEYLYAAAAGFVGSIFYCYVYEVRFSPIPIQ